MDSDKNVQAIFTAASDDESEDDGGGGGGGGGGCFIDSLSYIGSDSNLSRRKLE